MKKISMVMLCIIMVVTLAGCQKETKNEISKKVEQLEENSAQSNKKTDAKSDLEHESEKKQGALAKEIDIPDTFTLDLATDDGGLEAHMNVEVKVPTDQKPGVYQEKEVKMGIAKANAFAKKLFDGGEYQQVKPLFCYTKEELIKEKAKLLSELKEKDSDTFLYNKTRFTEILLLLKDKQNAEYKKNANSKKKGGVCRYEAEMDYKTEGKFGNCYECYYDSFIFGVWQ